MDTASLAQIKKEAATLGKEELVALVVRLSKHKKENKELAAYLLFYGNDESSFVSDAKEEMDAMFAEVNQHHAYLAKKTIRKILRLVSKHSKFSSHKTTEVELLIHFCTHYKKLPAVIRQSNVLYNLYQRQIAKLAKTLSALHEDIQWDCKQQIQSLFGDDFI